MENFMSEHDQLAAIAQARANLADRLITPWWYHPVLGLLFGAYVVAVGLGNTVLRSLAVVLFVLCCTLLMQVYRRMTGVWVNSTMPGPARRWAVAMGVICGVVVAGGIMIGLFADVPWVVWSLGALAGVVIVVLGRHYDTVLRAQLRGQL
jgi:hypothetical protein